MSAAVADVRSADPRPALADVLAALTGESRGAWLAILREYVGLPRDLRWERDALVWGRPWQVQREGGRDPRVTRRGLTAATPAEAVEVLATRGLWPWPVGDDASPRWWCERCGERGERHDTADPPSLAALVAVASLGCDTLRRAEGLALQLVGRAPRLTFRAVSRETLRAWTEERVYRDGDASLAYVAAHEALGAPSTSPLHYGHGETWPESFPWLGLSGGHVARRHWSMVRDLGLLGAMLVDLDGDRVTLAVEAI